MIENDDEMRDENVLSDLSRLIGAENVIRDEALKAPFLHEPRGLYQGQALAVVRPGSTQEVAAIVTYCAHNHIAIVPQGGNTGLVAGQLAVGYQASHNDAPLQSERRALVLSLSRMNRLCEIDTISNTMTVEAGMTLAEARAHADKAGRLFPLSIASENHCTIGGNLASNAGGLAALSYGNARALTLGLEAVMADGRVMNLLGKLIKDNSGYDLKNLIIGSEGTLGIITRAVLKLYPKPQAIVTVLLGLQSPHAALDVLQDLRARDIGLMVSFELMARIGVAFVLNHRADCTEPFADAMPWYGLVEFNGGDADMMQSNLQNALQSLQVQGLVLQAKYASDVQGRAALWWLRKELPTVQRFEGGSIKHDVSVPLSAIPEFIEKAHAALTAYMPEARPVTFGHMGDGNIHLNVSQPPDMDSQDYLSHWDAMNACVHDVVRNFGGSIAAEHGVGYLKRDILPDFKDATALAAMAAIKRALDPNNILNPGKTISI